MWEMYGEFLITYACETGWDKMLSCMATNLQVIGLSTVPIVFDTHRVVIFVKRKPKKYPKSSVE